MALIYHIAMPAAWAQAQEQGDYRVPSIGVEGFIHCSTEAQLLPSAARHFEGHDALLLLVIEEDLVRPDVRHELSVGGGGVFPHIYGPLNLDAVREARPLSRGADGTFTWPSEAP